MGLHQLKYASEAARCRSISQAAHNLYVSRQAVSKAISSLEHEIGHAIFDRERMNPTPFGEKALEHIDDVLHAVDAFETFADSYAVTKHNAKTLSIALTAFPLDYLFLDDGNHIMRAIAAFQNTANGCSISLLHFPDSTIVKAIEEGRVDAGIVCGDYKTEGVSYTALSPIDMRVIAHKNNPLCRHESLHIEDFRGISVRCPLDLDIFMQKFITLCATHGFSPSLEDVPLNDASIEAFMDKGGVHMQPFSPSMRDAFPHLAFIPLAESGFHEIPFRLACPHNARKELASKFCDYFLHALKTGRR